MFTIGIGPSSSHTVGPMRAARRFIEQLDREGLLDATHAVFAEMFGSLGSTGRGHGTDRAVLLGLEGETPEKINPDEIDHRIGRIRREESLHLLGRKRIDFCEERHLLLHLDRSLLLHPNGMAFTACGTDGKNPTPSGVLFHRRRFCRFGGEFSRLADAGRRQFSVSL